MSEPNRVFWTAGARPQPGAGPGRRWRRLALPFGLLGLAALVAGLADVPFPLDERAGADVILLAQPPTQAAADACFRLADTLRNHPSTATLRLLLGPDAYRAFAAGRSDVEEPAAGPWSAAERLRELCAQDHTRPCIVLWLCPHGDDNLARWTDLGREARRHNVHIAAIVPPAESLPSARVVLPTRQLPSLDPKQRFGGTFAVTANNLDLLSGLPRVALTAHAAERQRRSTGFNLKKLRARFPERWLEPDLGDEGPDLTLNFRNLDYHGLTFGAQAPGAVAADGPGARRTNLLWHPAWRDDIVAADTDCFETVLLDGDRPVSRSLTVVDQDPLRTFYLATPNLLKSPRWPALPQDLDAGDNRSATRPTWNLLWRPADPSALTVFCPADHKAMLPASRAEDYTAAKDADRSRLFAALARPSGDGRPGPIAAKLPTAEELQAFQAVVLDASVPAGLTEDIGLLPPTTQHPDAYRRAADRVLYAGGFFQPDESKVLGPTVKEQNEFLKALRDYVRGGGALILIGGNRTCWDKPPTIPEAKMVNWRMLLEQLDPALVQGEGGKSPFRPNPRPRRFVLAFDDSESAARADTPGGAFPTLPPLAPTREQPTKERPNAGKLIIPRKHWKHYADQIETFLARPAIPDKTDDPERMTLQLPSRADLTELVAGELGLGPSSGQGADPEFQALLPRTLLDSKTDFAVTVADWLRGQFNHPNLVMDVQGRPAFRHAYPPPDLAAGQRFQFPLSPKEGSPVLWPNRYATLLGDDLSVDVRGDRHLLARPVPGDKVTLIDSLEWQNLTQYLAKEVYSGTGPSPIVVGLLDRDDLIDTDGGDVSWAVTLAPGKGDGANGKPFRRTRTKPQSFVARPGQHFVFLGSLADAKRSKAGDLDTALGPTFVSGRDALRPRDWWSIEAGLADARDARGDGRWERLLYMGRGRFCRLLTYALADEVQSLRCRPAPDFAGQVRRLSDAPPEAVDFLGRVLYERLQLSAPPATVLTTSGSPWTALAQTADGIPILAAAKCPVRPANGERQGTVVTCFWDHAYEAAQYNRRGMDYLAWTDFSPTCRTDNGSLHVRPLSYSLQSERAEYRWAGYRLKAHKVQTTTFPPLAAKDGQSVHVRIRALLYPYLGLAEAGKSMTCRPSPGEPDKIELLPQEDAGSEVEVTIPTDGLRFSIDRQAILEKYAPREMASGSTPLLPLLLELRLEGPDGDATSIFAPLPHRLQPDSYFVGALAYAAPSAQTIDLLLEVFGRKPALTLELLSRRSFRLVPRGKNAPSAQEADITLTDLDGHEVPPQWEVSRLLPGQLVFRVPDGWHGLGRRLQLRVTWPKERGLPPEWHRLFIPDGPADELPLVPAEQGRPFPRPGEMVLDTLATVTAPAPFHDRLLAEGDGATWDASHRGVLVAPLSADGAAALERFARDAIEERTAIGHSRNWFLAALVCWALAAVAGAIRSRA